MRSLLRFACVLAACCVGTLVGNPSPVDADPSHPLFIAPVGEAAGDEHGMVSGAGDVNGDGFDDVVVGALGNDAGGENAGRAYVYYLGPAADEVPDLILTGEDAGDFFGAAVSGAGDVNQDGYADIVIGATNAGPGFQGRAYVYYGGPGADDVPEFILTGLSAGDAFGSAVSDAGDVNGDGFDDIIVGALFGDEAFVYYLGPGADTAPDLMPAGLGGQDFGKSVSGAGDVNDDDYDDFLIGHPGYNPQGGAAYLYYGGPSADNQPDLFFFGESASINRDFGWSVSDAGDVNGDGSPDIVVGDISASATGDLEGRTYVYFLGPGTDTFPDLILLGELPFDNFGESVSGLGDINQDGFDDVITSAILHPGGALTGRAYVYFGGPAPDTVPDIILDGEATEDLYGFPVSGAGDVNGDTVPDFVIGARWNDAGGDEAGRAYVYASDSDCSTGSDCRDGWAWFGLRHDGANIGQGQSFELTCSSTVLEVQLQVRNTGMPNGGVPSMLQGDEIECALVDPMFTEIATATSGMPFDVGEGTISFDFSGLGVDLDPGEYLLLAYTDVPRQATMGFCATDSYPGGERHVSLGGLDGPWTPFPTSDLPFQVLVEVGTTALGDQPIIAPVTSAAYLGNPTPNPFNPATRWTYSVLEQDWVLLRIYDSSGRLVRVLFDGVGQPGTHVARWDGRSQSGRVMASGIYFLRMETGSYHAVRKLVMTR